MPLPNSVESAHDISQAETEFDGRKFDVEDPHINFMNQTSSCMLVFLFDGK